jgi:hypothetical protein
MRFMEEFNPYGATWRRLVRQIPSSRVGLVLAASLGMIATGCNSLTSGSGGTSSNTPQSPSQLYFAPQMEAQSLTTYAIDHAASAGYPEGTFVRTTYSVNGATITDSGGIDLPGSKPSNGVLSLATTYIDGSEPIAKALTGSWAIELPGQAALVQMNTPAVSGIGGVTIDAVNFFTPAVPTQSCPTFTSSETFQFVTIPNILSQSAAIAQNNWNPQLETAFGSVEIAATGTSVSFSNLSQYTLPAGKGGSPGKPEYPAPASATSSCFQTSYGQTISVPNSVTVTNPGVDQTVAPSATIGIGPSGFLVEDAGSGAADPKTGLTYENFLGAGYGAIGLPSPSSDLTSSLVSAHYQGFLYAAGTSGFSLISSFGYPDLRTSCPTLPAPKTSTILYGGEFANNDPSASAFGNCDLAIDLGKQDAQNNGLYPAATVYVTSSFPQNAKGPAYSFSAVAVAGQLQGKNAIFLIGADTIGSPNRAWGIYLLQSN